MRTWTKVVFVVLFTLLSFTLNPPSGLAGTMATTVTSPFDSGPGSLRQAILDTLPGGAITFDSGLQGQTITLTSGTLNIANNVTIDGTGQNITISGNGVSRVFLVTAGSFTLSNLTISQGNAGPENGGAIFNNNGATAMSINNCTFTNNTAIAGGAIYSSGPLTAINCTFTGNTASNGTGIHIGGTFGGNISYCTFSGNAGGPALSSALSGFTLSGCIIWNNVGGEYIGNGTETINNCDIQNYTGTGIGNTNADPLLGSLGNYGGSVSTMPLLPGSPCINNGGNPSTPAADARGVVRDAFPDLGAFESRGFNLSISSGNNQATVINTEFASPLVVGVASSSGEPVAGGQVAFTPPPSGASAVIPPATIQAGGTASSSATANGAVGSYTVTASASGASPVSFSLTNLPDAADLSIVKTHTGTLSSGGDISYTITVSNNGPAAASSVSVSDTLPPGTTFVSLTAPGGWSCTTPAVGLSGTVTASVASLAYGSTSTFTLTIHVGEGVAAGTAITNTTNVSSATPDPNSGNDTASDSGTVVPSMSSGVTVNPTSLSISEGGAAQTFSVCLNNQPTADVIITVGSSDTSEMTVGTSALTFTSSNWATNQMVTVTPVDDGLLDGDQTAAVQLGVSAGSAAAYLAIDPADVTVTVHDRINAAPVLTANAGSNRVSLSWTPVAEAASYSVYTSTTSGSFPDAPVSVSSAVNQYEAAGLTSNRTYYFMVQAVDSLGNSVDSNPVSAVPYHESGGSGGHTTSPTVTTNAAVSVSASAAVLKGNIAGGNLFMREYGFYYGSETGSLNQHKIVGDEDFSGNFSCELNGLDPEQTYYFQAYAITNNGQTVYGKTIQFTTARTTEPAAPGTQPDEQLPPGQNFADVPDSYWAREAILEMSAKGYISGYRDGTFRPDEKISRAEFVTILVRALHLQADTNGRVFRDTADHWAKESIAIAASLNLCAGYADGSFKPDSPITREEMAVMAVKAAALAEASGETSFADNARIAAWAKGSVLAAVNQSILKGYPDNTFRPRGNASRAEAVMVIKGLIK